MLPGPVGSGRDRRCDIGCALLAWGRQRWSGEGCLGIVAPPGGLLGHPVLELRVSFKSVEGFGPQHSTLDRP